MKKLPVHPKHHHKPFRLKHFGLFFLGLLVGIFGTYRGGYISPQEFDVNRISPSVVKVYHFVCGDLKYKGQIYGRDSCEAKAGSGFLISSDGYIATNGHVVILSPADVLVSKLLANPFLLQQVAARSGVSLQPISDRTSAFSFLASLHDLSPKELSIENKREAIFVALGDRPLVIDQKNPKKVFGQTDTDYIKKAKLVASNYSSKDLLSIEQNKSEKGFSASDVALIKANIVNAPVLSLGDGKNVNQNDPTTLIGFPTDADNQLTANDRISPSVTNGVISSIRNASGIIQRLFQSDADASQGNSGGPAVNKKGEAIGVVTYRFKDNHEANAAKSYIRDIDDLKTLLKDNAIKLNTASKTQDYWENGLKLASENKFSKASEQYRMALSTYPAHRLVGSYLATADQAIKDGKDVKEPPYALFITLGAIFGGLAMIIFASMLIVGHRINHQRYKNLVVNRKRSKKR